ncbi:MAG TPA: hypothetical protein VJU86_07065 [Pyrinomonadaceae bacterium]|nr:hypothetical protein [Pyrinomonadaceae bacterium]
MRNHPRSALVSVSICLVLLLAPALAGAGAPVIEEFDTVANNEVFANCGDFLIIANGAGHSRLTTYFNRDGQPIRVQFHGHYSGTLTNSITGASLVDSPSVANITFDLINGTQTNVGPFFNITVPGQGNVYFQVGRIVFDGNGPPVFIAGQQPPPPQTVAILCQALQ